MIRMILVDFIILSLFYIIERATYLFLRKKLVNSIPSLYLLDISVYASICLHVLPWKN